MCLSVNLISILIPFLKQEMQFYFHFKETLGKGVTYGAKNSRMDQLKFVKRQPLKNLNCHGLL